MTPLLCVFVCICVCVSVSHICIYFLSENKDSSEDIKDLIRTSTPVRTSERQLSDCINMKEEVFDCRRVRIELTRYNIYPKSSCVSAAMFCFLFRNVGTRRRNSDQSGFS